MMFFGISEHHRVYAIGDVHGRADALLGLLKKILKDAEQCADKRRTFIVFLGDYVDRGDNAAQVIKYIRSLNPNAGQGVIALKGNHEAALIEFLADPVANRSWLSFGARQTIASYGVPQPPARPTPEDLFRLRDELDAAMAEDVAFLAGLPAYFELGAVLFTHAGVNPSLGDGCEDEHAMLWGHPSGLIDDPLPGRMVVHGHYESEIPIHRKGRISIDTGAYHSGRLTALRLDSEASFLSTRSMSSNKWKKVPPNLTDDGPPRGRSRIPSVFAARLLGLSKPNSPARIGR